MKAVFLTVCAVATVSGLVGYLCRGWSCEKAIRLVCACLCAVTVWQAVTGALPLLERHTVGQSSLSVPDEWVTRTAEQVVRTVLQEAGMTPKDVICSADISPSGHIQIERVTVVIDTDEERVRSLLAETVNAGEVEIVHE